MNGHVAEYDFTANLAVIALLIAAQDDRNKIMRVRGDVYRWTHLPDANGRGTKPGNERTDFHRWVGRVLTIGVSMMPVSHEEEVVVRGHGLTVTRR